ncbi:MAG TPA: hypothetical protein VJS91_10930 [Nitrososphaeraceae archaeon]|nr:hypothetical protein [Nitrososphaeraceae archaeon]
MVIFNVSEKWNNGKSRTLTRAHEFDPFDDKVECAAGAKATRKVVIDGQGNCTISGDKVRIYCHYENYNSRLTVTLIPHFKGRKDEGSLKLRSRHEELEKECVDGKPVDPNAFGGYGFAVGRIKNGGKTKFEWDAKRELTHNCYDQFDADELPKKLENGKAVIMRHTVKDEDGKVRQIGEIDYMDGSGFHRVMDRFDKSPKSWMIDRGLYEDQSYIWIRNNGSGSITVRDVTLEILP